ASLHLITEYVPGRYRSHDLLRTYAAELAGAHEPEGTRQAALHRALDHYLHTAYAAARLLTPNRDPITLAAPLPGVSPEPLRDHRQALAWLTAHRPVLTASVEAAAAGGFDSHVHQLAWALDMFFF